MSKVFKLELTFKSEQDRESALVLLECAAEEYDDAVVLDAKLTEETIED